MQAKLRLWYDPAPPHPTPTQSFKPLLFTYRKDSGGECGIPYDRRFNMPGPELKSKDFLTGSRNIYHSVNVGMVHFIMLSSEHNMTKGSEQYIWLENDLKSVDRKVHPWIVFGQHRPYYGTTIVRVHNKTVGGYMRLLSYTFLLW